MYSNNIIKIGIIQNYEKEQILNNNMNSLIKFENDCFYFKNQNKNSNILIFIEFYMLDINQGLINDIDNIINMSAKKAESICPGNMDNNIDPIKKLIENIVNKFLYRADEDRLDIFDFFSELLFRVIVEHKIFDGNKRMGIVTLANIMNYFGYYLRWTKNENKTKIKYEKHYESFLIKIIDYHENTREDQQIMKKIKKLLQEWTVIDISKLSNDIKY